MNESGKLLLLFAMVKCIPAVVRLHCEKRVCTVYNLRSSEDSFVYRYFPNDTITVVHIHLQVEYADRVFLEDIRPSIESVVITASAPLARISLSGRSNASSLTIADTGLSRLDVVEENHQLQQLLIMNSQLTRVPDMIGQLRGLVTLRIKNSPIVELDLTQFCQLPRLYYLDVRSNQISHVFRTAPTNVRCPVPIVYVYLAENNLSVLNMTTFDGFTRLKYLDLHNNMLHSLTDSFVGPVLQDLRLFNNNLTTLSFCQWYVPELRRLALSMNRLTGVPKCMINAPNISYLNLCSNNISSVTLATFAGMDNLRYLDVCRNRLTSAVLNSTSYPKSLATVGLGRNRLTQLDLSWVPLRKVHLGIEHNFISQFDISKVSANVTTLTMTGNPIDCSWSAQPVPGLLHVDRASAQCVRDGD
ncbi:podocan-like protein 1 [Anopheles stephensi]|uniref:podocan-like protein 1 n=1 Tax=Anopheles stephensi TaxID=30069 RepID=UPI00165878F8|nr:podocan-like protein 1 [Anopheles stephensi]